MYLHCKVHGNPKDRKRRERIRQHEVGEYFYIQNLVSLAYKFRLFPATDHQGKGVEDKPTLGTFSAVSGGASSFCMAVFMTWSFQAHPLAEGRYYIPGCRSFAGQGLPEAQKALTCCLLPGKHVCLWFHATNNLQNNSLQHPQSYYH